MTAGAPIPVFAGPSLPASARPPGPFDWRPPAGAGDLIDLLDRPPARLCLIDGFFDSRAAPWHKELLWLMARGTIVFGAASIGALRAAELHPFGLIGIGAIFRAFAADRLQGDDEVALVHAPEALGWRPLTVPMVEVRATLVAAVHDRLISRLVARRMRDRVHELHFDVRDWPAMRSACAGELVDGATFDALAARHVPLKRQDALACVTAAVSWNAPARRTAPPPDTCFIRRLQDQRARGAAVTAFG